jgi:hypothetical protein
MVSAYMIVSHPNASLPIRQAQSPDEHFAVMTANVAGIHKIARGRSQSTWLLLLPM